MRYRLKSLKSNPNIFSRKFLTRCSNILCISVVMTITGLGKTFLMILYSYKEISEKKKSEKDKQTRRKESQVHFERTEMNIKKERKIERKEKT